MKTFPAIAAFEFDDIAVGVWVTDAMLKRAPIAFFKSGTITAGRYLTLIGGTTASVGESAGEAIRHAGDHLVDHVFLSDVHPRLYTGVLGARRSRASGAVAVLETSTVSASVRAAEAALKGTAVELVEIRLGDSGLAGKGLIVLEGDLHDVDAAISLALERAGEGGVNVSWRVIPAPHDALFAQIAHASAFAACQIIDLEGETV
jgi:microcompartment protein CcmL/EutN